MVKGQFFQWSWNYKENSLNKDMKKEKSPDQHDLSDHSVSNNKWPTSWFQNFGHQNWLQGDTMITDKHDEVFSN